jgi:hypothetical protein
MCTGLNEAAYRVPHTQNMQAQQCPSPIGGWTALVPQVEKTHFLPHFPGQGRTQALSLTLQSLQACGRTPSPPPPMAAASPRQRRRSHFGERQDTLSAGMTNRIVWKMSSWSCPNHLAKGQHKGPYLSGEGHLQEWQKGPKDCMGPQSLNLNLSQLGWGKWASDQKESSSLFRELTQLQHSDQRRPQNGIPQGLKPKPKAPEKELKIPQSRALRTPKVSQGSRTSAANLWVLKNGSY